MRRWKFEQRRMVRPTGVKATLPRHVELRREIRGAQSIMARHRDCFACDPFAPQRHQPRALGRQSRAAVEASGPATLATRPAGTIWAAPLRDTSISGNPGRPAFASGLALTPR